MKSKLVGIIAKWALGGIFRDIAEGKKGEKLKALYWKAAGKKTVTGAIMGVLFAALLYFDPSLGGKVEPVAVMVIGLLVGWGLVDKSWRAGKPLAEWGHSFREVMSWGPALSAIVALLVEYLPKIQGCSWCGPLALKIQLAAAGVAAATAWLAARFTDPPVKA